ncbi:MAG: TIGR04348 family glycosyltransferase, partial [Planctomycetota bacterium]
MMKPLTIQIVCPARAGTQHGNRVTALRWCRMLRELGHRPVVVDAWTERACDVLLALHASKSAPSIAGFRQTYPEGRLIVALTGTDLYRDFESNAAQRSIRMADQLVVLQPEALRKLSRTSRRKTAVIFQSVQPLRVVRPATPRRLRVVVAGHLRALEDPLRPALAARQLPSRSRIVIQHFGGVLEHQWKSRVEAEMKRNSRYLWFGERTR